MAEKSAVLGCAYKSRDKPFLGHGSKAGQRVWNILDQQFSPVQNIHARDNFQRLCLCGHIQLIEDT